MVPSLFLPILPFLSAVALLEIFCIVSRYQCRQSLGGHSHIHGGRSLGSRKHHGELEAGDADSNFSYDI